MVGSVSPSTLCRKWTLSRHLQKLVVNPPWPVICLDFVPCTWKVILIRCIFILLFSLVETLHTEGLGGGGGASRVTNSDWGLLGGLGGAEDPPGIPAKDAWSIRVRAPGDNFPSPGHKDGNEGTLTCTTAGRKTPAPRSTPGANLSQKKVIAQDENAAIFP